MPSSGSAESTTPGDAPTPLPISQIAIVVRDIEMRSASTTARSAGGPGTSTNTGRRRSTTPTCAAADRYTMIGAETHVGPIVVELIQPVQGPSIYQEWLDAHGEGLHHIAVMRPTPEESEGTRAHFKALGATC